MHLRSSELKAMGLLHGNSLRCLLGCHCCELRVGRCSRPSETCWWWKRGRRDGLLKLLFEFPSTDVDDGYRTLVKANRTTRISTSELVALQLHVQSTYFHSGEGSCRLVSRIVYHGNGRCSLIRVQIHLSLPIAKLNIRQSLPLIHDPLRSSNRRRYIFIWDGFYAGYSVKSSFVRYRLDI